MDKLAPHILNAETFGSWTKESLFREGRKARDIDAEYARRINEMEEKRMPYKSLVGRIRAELVARLDADLFNKGSAAEWTEFALQQLRRGDE